MDGLVLALAVILNPRAMRGAQRGEQRSHDGVRVDPGDSGTAAAVVPASAVQDNSEKDQNSLEDHPI
jgi:hypothetical protein